MIINNVHFYCDYKEGGLYDVLSIEDEDEYKLEMLNMIKEGDLWKDNNNTVTYDDGEIIVINENDVIEKTDL